MCLHLEATQALMHFTDIVKATANNCHMPGKYWVIQHALTIHSLPVPFQPAKCLLHYPPCADYAVIEAVPVGRLTNLIPLHAGGFEGKG